MSDDDDLFNPNAYEDKQEAEALAAMKEDLNSVVTIHEIEGAGQTPVTKLDIISHSWRQTATRLLRVIDEDSWIRYKALKYAGGDNPDHATRMKAYEFAVIAFLRASYKLANC